MRIARYALRLERFNAALFLHMLWLEIRVSELQVLSVATPVAPSTEYKYMKYNKNKLTLKLTLTLTLNLKTNPNPNRCQ